MEFETCSKCNKIFDYDKHNGVCPNCGRYNRINTPEDEHQDLHDTYDNGYMHTIEDYNYDNQANDANSEEDTPKNVRYMTEKETKVHLIKYIAAPAVIAIVVLYIFDLGFIWLPVLIWMSTMISKLKLRYWKWRLKKKQEKERRL